MENGLYEAQWPRDGMYVSCFVHQVMNFRYHWHPDDYELSILLSGEQYFCRGRESYHLQVGDAILIEPNEGHASYGQAQNTIALVLHFSTRSMKSLTPRGKALVFPSCCSNAETRYTPRYKNLRGLAAQLILSLSNGGPYAQFTAKACTEMLISLLCNSFDPVLTSGITEIDEETQRTMRTILSYMEENYAVKITLEDIASLGQYNRTYISTLFHKAVGVSFYEYLMRVRLQNAMKELVMTNKNLTEIALNNGFADLKSFNARFRGLLQCLPSEYRKGVKTTLPQIEDYHERKYIPCGDPFVHEKLMTFMEGTSIAGRL